MSLVTQDEIYFFGSVLLKQIAARQFSGGRDGKK
jgi:hypothetical protein